MKVEFYCFAILILWFQSLSVQAQTIVDKVDDRWILQVDGNPFKVKGVTFGYDKDVNNYDSYFKDLKFLGVNTIRLWATNENTSKLLDVAQAYDVKVMIGIWMRHGRPGMEDDDRFNYLEDGEGKETMYENAMAVVNRYKDHPAVLMWAIGNEVYLNTATDEEKVAYSKLLERICSDIKKNDNTHPIASVEAWTFGMDWWQQYVPSIDIYGLNSYGPGANYLSSEMEKKNIDKPYIITEFGVTGEWDIKEEKNGIKKEPSDQEKYNAITNGYNEWIKNKSNCLGVYIFHYSSGNSFISPWLFTHHNGMYRPQYWAVRNAYTGAEPMNKVPEIHSFELTDAEVESESWVNVNLDVSDTEGEALEVDFYYNQRMGSRKRRDQINKLESRGDLSSGFKIKMPKEDGLVKIYVLVNDTYNNLGIASTSILVSDLERRKVKYLVPKKELPFYIYQDGGELPYIPTGYMGNHKAITVDVNCTEEVHTGETAIKIGFDAFSDWYGVAFVDPANDWGDILGGYDIQGAKKFTFWAKASKKNVKATIGFGLIDKNKPFPDTSKKSKEIKLGTKWKKYTIKLKNLDLSCIRSGLVLFSATTAGPQDIYLDDVVFE